MLTRSRARPLRDREVVCCFEDNDIVHVNGEIDPKADIDVINLELVFSDLYQSLLQVSYKISLSYPNLTLKKKGKNKIKMKKINSLLRKCKSLSRQLGRSSSYSSLRSKSTREDLWVCERKMEEEEEEEEEKVSGSNVIIYVGSTRKRYAISSKYLSHPLLNALIDKSKSKAKANEDHYYCENNNAISVRCEVVLFDHLLWMLENSDPNITFDSNLEELAELYVF